MIQNSVVGAVGSIFNGIANGQNIFKSALIGFTGINYTFDIGNNVTSTDGISTAYRYIVSPDYNEAFDESAYVESIYGGLVGPGGPGTLIGTLAEGGLKMSAAGAIGTVWYVFNTAFGSAHIPDHSGYAWRYTGTKPLTIADVKAEYKIREKNKQTGSYTIMFSDGHKYHGKGPLERMLTSAMLKMTQYNVMLKSFDWTPSPTDREAFKAEYRRLQTDRVPRLYEQGYRNPINFNILQSPGYKYILQDGY